MKYVWDKWSQIFFSSNFSIIFDILFDYVLVLQLNDYVLVHKYMFLKQIH